LVEFEGQFADDLGQRLGGLAFFGELRFESIICALEHAVLVGGPCDRVGRGVLGFEAGLEVVDEVLVVAVDDVTS
jgi:hypothetical protein